MNKNNILVGALVIAAFVIGSLYSKLQVLEKGGAPTNAGTGDAAAPQPAEPTPDFKALPPVTDKDHIRGSKDADVVLVEYSDYECPFCKSFHPTMEQIMKEYGNKVAWVFRHFPLSFHPKAQKTAEAGECIAELGGNDKFWEYTDLVYERMPAFELSQLPDLAAEIGVNKAKFQTCLDSGKYAKDIQDEMAGGTAAGVNGTPGTIIVGKNGKYDLIGGALPFEQAKQQIDALMK